MVQWKYSHHYVLLLVSLGISQEQHFLQYIDSFTAGAGLDPRKSTNKTSNGRNSEGLYGNLRQWMDHIGLEGGVKPWVGS